MAALLAVADLFRWGNRWYVSTQLAAPADELWAAHLLGDAHAALVSALLWISVLVVAAGTGWRLRVVRRREPSTPDRGVRSTPV